MDGEEKLLTIEKKYMVIPVNTHSKNKRVFFKKDGKLIYDFETQIDFVSPMFNTYLNVERFIGQTFSLSCDATIDLCFDFADSIPKVGKTKKEPLRPHVHFTANIGWINDPNGLVFDGEKYHMFFQHNPLSVKWGNMTWGHAVSYDLVNWEELDAALLPDELGTMFSGSAVVDLRNVSGFGKNAILLFYTAAGGTSLLSSGKQSCQCLAFSQDNGRTFKKYGGNPIIKTITSENRDPKVVWSDEIGCYLLSLYLEGHTFAIYRSSNLINWTEFCRVEMPYDAECPDMYKLKVENEENTYKWVFSAASDTYLVGEISSNDDVKGFVASQEEEKYLQGKRTSYAAQTFFGTAKRKIRVAWQILHAPNAVFENQMGVPCEISLYKAGDKYRLRSLPVSEFTKTRELEESMTATCARTISRALKKGAYDIDITPEKGCGDFNIELFGHTFFVKTGKGIFAYDDVEIPITYTGKLKIRIIFDTLGCEIFLDDGLIYSVKQGICDYGINKLAIYPTEKCTALAAKVDIYRIETKNA